MTDPAIMIRARQLAAASKRWGRPPEAAILSGQWDSGSIVRGFIEEATNQLLRERPEAEYG